MIAKIAVAAANFAIDKPYSYSVSQGLTVQPGCRVTVPFGKGNRRTEGVVLSVEAGDETGLKAVEQVLDDVVFINGGRVMLHASVDEIRENHGMSVDAYFREVFRC